MPFLIKEIVVTATVNSATNDSGLNAVQNTASSNSNGIDKTEIIQDCVDQVLEILKEKCEP